MQNTSTISHDRRVDTDELLPVRGVGISLVCARMILEDQSVRPRTLLLGVTDVSGHRMPSATNDAKIAS